MRPNSDFQYEVKLLAFIDILGWRNLIENSATDLDIQKYVASSYEQLGTQAVNLKYQNDYFKKIGKEQYGPSVEATQFSDTVVFSCPVQMPLYFGMLLSIFSTCSSLLEHGIYTRGALTVGQIYHKNDAIFGPALIRAYDIERNVAIYPRIVVDDLAATLIRKHQETVKVELSFHKSDLLRLDRDGVSYLNVLTPPIMLPDAILSSHREKLRQCLALVDMNCKNDANDLRLMMKHIWLRNYIHDLLNEVDAYTS